MLSSLEEPIPITSCKNIFKVKQRTIEKFLKFVQSYRSKNPSTSCFYCCIVYDAKRNVLIRWRSVYLLEFHSIKITFYNSLVYDAKRRVLDSLIYVTCSLSKLYHFCIITSPNYDSLCYRVEQLAHQKVISIANSPKKGQNFVSNLNFKT